ncbi:hypothetical protein [Alkalihalophilus pseudofirmus]
MYQEINHNGRGFKIAFSIQTVFYGVVLMFFVLAYLTYKDQSKAGKQG